MSFVYFIKRLDTGHIKIGFSCNPKRRCWKVATEVGLTAAGVELLAFAPGGRTEEARMHQRFIQTRTDGEWFEPTANLLWVIDVVRKTGELPLRAIPVTHSGFARIGDNLIPTFAITRQPDAVAA